MKKIFTLVMMAMMLSATGANAQSLRKTWDFRTGFSQQTVNALKGDQEEFGADKYWRNYESDSNKADEQHYWNASKDAKNGDGFACTHNGGMEKVIPELEGLVLGMSNAKKFVITYNGAMKTDAEKYADAPENRCPYGPSYVWLNGKNETIKFKAEVNQTIKIGVESHKDTEARGISLSTSTGTLELTQGNPVPIFYTECEWMLTGDDGAVAEVTLKSTNGCHIYYIIVGEGDDLNANKTKVAYLTAGDGASETAYQALAADEMLNVTVLDVNAAFTPEMLADYDASVISPAIAPDNAAVSTLKQAVAFYPIVNLNAGLYAAWGYGEASTTGLPIALVNDLKSQLLYGFGEGDYTVDGENYIVEMSGSDLMAVHLGDYFAGDQMPLVDGNDPTAAVAHVHNPYHNAYIYLAFADDATEVGKKLLVNAIDMAKGSKSEITQSPAPKIALEYKNQNTNITLSMASSTLPRPHIYYTLDGSIPTEQSQEYTDVINVWNPCTVKAVAIAEGYLLSEVAETYVDIFSQPDMAAINCEYQDGKTLVSLTCGTPDVDLWYSFNKAEAADTTKSMKYTGEPIVIALPTDFTAFSVAGKQVFSELAQQRIVVKNAKVRQDQLGLFDANAADWQKGGSGSTIYFFSWGKNARSIYDTTQEPVGVDVDPETGDEVPVYPEMEYEYYVPENSENYWEVKSKGQVMIWQNLSVGTDPGNDAGYNPETTGDILSYAKATNHDIQFGGKTSGEPCTGAIQSLKKFQGPFDIVTVVGTAAGGDNQGRMQVEVSKDSLEWTKVGDEMLTSKVKRLWKTYTRSYDEADEVYVRVVQVGGGSSVQIYNIYILNEGENSTILKQQYDEEFANSGVDGITDVMAAKAATGIYNLNGMRLTQMQHGLNIVVGPDGKAKKVLK